MTRKKAHKGEAADGPRTGWRFWLPVALILPAIVVLGLTVRLMGKPGVSAADSLGGEAGRPSPSSLGGKLAGRWLRPDGGYVLTIRGIGADGKVDASYNNPRPIHVARAEVRDRGDRLDLYVELRDRNYPGSYYTLNYDSARDQLVGVYRHLGLNQDFDVYFIRFR